MPFSAPKLRAEGSRRSASSPHVIFINRHRVSLLPSFIQCSHQNTSSRHGGRFWKVQGLHHLPPAQNQGISAALPQNSKKLTKNQCDLARPGCERCSKAGLECERYEKYAVFIRKGLDGWEKRRPLEETKPKHDANRTVPPRLQSIAIEATPFFDYFYRTFVCSPRPSVLQQDYMDPDSWSRGLEFVKSDSLLHGMILAVSMVYCGKKRRDRDVLIQGRKWYSRSLCELCNSLGAEASSHDDEVLVTTSVCMAYETIDPSDPVSSAGWGRHLGGMTRLVQHRGPTNFGNARNRDVLEDVRFMLMMSGLINRKSSFLTKDAWMTNPWKSSGKSIQQQVVDCGLLLGDVFERIDHLPAQSNTATTNAIARLINECVLIDGSLQKLAAESSLRIDYEKASGASLRGTQLSPDSASTFDTASSLRLLITIFGIRLHIYEAIRHLESRPGIQNLATSAEHTAQTLTSVSASTLDLISRYLDLCIGSISKGRHVFALEHVLAQFDSTKEEFFRCSQLLRRLQDGEWAHGLPDDLESWCVMVTNPQKSDLRASLV